jgi:hypothetical protein
MISLDRKSPDYPASNLYIRAVACVVFSAFHARGLIEVEEGKRKPIVGGVTWNFLYGHEQLDWCLAVDKFLFDGSLPLWFNRDEDFELFRAITRSMAKAVGIEDHSDDARLQAADAVAG